MRTPAAEALALAGCRVVLASRSVEAGKSAVDDEVPAGSPPPTTTREEQDLEWASDLSA